MAEQAQQMEMEAALDHYTIAARSADQSGCDYWEREIGRIAAAMETEGNSDADKKD